MFNKKLISILCVIIMLVLFTGCTNKNEEVIMITADNMSAVFNRYPNSLGE